MVKKGDTLIEVTLAIGIFSMVAVAVVAVMNGGTSSAQTSLEATLAREEIDTQAEALRFIHTAYVAGDANATEIWRQITSPVASTDDSDPTTYAPSSCDNLYSGDQRLIDTQNSFIIDTHALSHMDTNTNGVVIRSNGSGAEFSRAQTYPRLIYNDSDDSLEGGSISGSDLARVEGIYIVAVSDEKKTNVVVGNHVELMSAFYDFYIRTCWYGSGSESPSTISTVIRLYNPNPS